MGCPSHAVMQTQLVALVILTTVCARPSAAAEIGVSSGHLASYRLQATSDSPTNSEDLPSRISREYLI